MRKLREVHIQDRREFFTLSVTPVAIAGVRAPHGKRLTLQSFGPWENHSTYRLPFLGAAFGAGHGKSLTLQKESEMKTSLVSSQPLPPALLQHRHTRQRQPPACLMRQYAPTDSIKMDMNFA